MVRTSRLGLGRHVAFPAYSAHRGSRFILISIVCLLLSILIHILSFTIIAAMIIVTVIVMILLITVIVVAIITVT